MPSRPVHSFKRRKDWHQKTRKRKKRNLSSVPRGIKWIGVRDKHFWEDNGDVLRKIMVGGNAGLNDCVVEAPGVCMTIDKDDKGNAELLLKIEGQPTTLFDVHAKHVNNVETFLKSYVDTYSNSKNIELSIPHFGAMIRKIVEGVSSIGDTNEETNENPDLSGGGVNRFRSEEPDLS